VKKRKRDEDKADRVSTPNGGGEEKTGNSLCLKDGDGRGWEKEGKELKLSSAHIGKTGRKASFLPRKEGKKSAL